MLDDVTRAGYAMLGRCSVENRYAVDPSDPFLLMPLHNRSYTLPLYISLTSHSGHRCAVVPPASREIVDMRR